MRGFVTLCVVAALSVLSQSFVPPVQADSSSEYYYVCDDARTVLFMHTHDQVVYDGAKTFCTDRGASLPTSNDEACLRKLSKQLGDRYFWTTTLPPFKLRSGIRGDGHFQASTDQDMDKFNVACVQRRICIRPKDPAHGSYSNGV
eukprot:scpid99438/ scgid13640/ 